VGAAVLEYVGALQAGVQLVRDARSLYRDWKAAKGGAPEELEQKLEQAEHQLELAKAVAAQDLGYRLCRCDFAPQIMTVTRVDDDGMEYWRCQNCGREQGPPRTRGHW
jgi:hypothetical protein